MQAGNERTGLKLSVIIVNYNVKFYLELCLLSVRRAMEGVEAEVIVVDNHSRDGSVEYLSQRFPWVTIISSAHNLGFAKANNRAIRQSMGEYVLLLNPDTWIGEDVLRECLLFMDGHPRSGSVGVRMLKTNGEDAMESRRGIPTPMTSFYKMTGLCARFPKNRVVGKYYMGHLPWDRASQIEVVSGAFCMLRRQALDEVGLLDEDFFMYGEDIDLSYRLIKGGWENWYLPLKILHYKGESTQKTNFRYVHVFYEAMFIFFRKHYGNLSFFLAFPIRAGIVCKAVLALLRMLVEKGKYSLGFVRRSRVEDAVYLLDLAEDNREACGRLVRRCALRAEAMGEDGSWHESASIDNTRIYRVYDISKYTFKEILEQMSSQIGENISVAVYNPENNSIITDGEIIV